MRRWFPLNALFLCALFTGSAAGADTAQMKAVPDATLEVAASTAAFAWRSTAPLSVAAVLAHFEAFDRELLTLSAHFNQSLTMTETGIASLVEGTVAYKKFDRLRIEHIRPERQTVVADGKNIWIHRYSQAQVIQSDLAQWKRSDPLINNLMQFGSYGKMLRAYNLSLEKKSGIHLLHLRPKDAAAADFRLTFELDRKTLFPKATRLVAGSMVIRTSMDAIRFNPVLAADTFEFTPPEGVDVFRNFTPPKFQP